MDYMTDLKRAVGMGSAREGTKRHWSMTKSSVALLILTPILRLHFWSDDWASHTTRFWPISSVHSLRSLRLSWL